MSRIVIASVLAGLALLAACAPAADQPADAAAPAQSAPLTANGDGSELQRQPVDSNLIWAASVVQLDMLTNEANGGVKLFGLAGGDPAMNGLHTYLAFYESPGDGWQVFQLGDFLEYRVLSEALGRVDLEITESTMDEATGTIGSRTRFVIVTWTRGEDNAPPMSITVTPAHT
jgi:hypothetical protein